jgi:hypothetical protein
MNNEVGDQRGNMPNEDYYTHEISFKEIILESSHLVDIYYPDGFILY